VAPTCTATSSTEQSYVDSAFYFTDCEGYESVLKEAWCLVYSNLDLLETAIEDERAAEGTAYLNETQVYELLAVFRGLYNWQYRDWNTRYVPVKLEVRCKDGGDNDWRQAWNNGYGDSHYTIYWNRRFLANASVDYAESDSARACVVTYIGFLFVHEVLHHFVKTGLHSSWYLATGFDDVGEEAIVAALSNRFRQLVWDRYPVATEHECCATSTAPTSCWDPA